MHYMNFFVVRDFMLTFIPMAKARRRNVVSSESNGPLTSRHLTCLLPLPLNYKPSHNAGLEPGATAGRCNSTQ